MNIIQQPLYRMVATDEEIIFVVEDNAVVVGNFRVKFIAEVYVSSYTGNPFSSHPSASKVATLKVVPNNEGVGIFDLSRILEAYVSPDYLGGETIIASSIQYYSEANGIGFDTLPHSIHQIDKHSTNRNACRLVGVKFSAEYATSQTGTLINTGVLTTSELYYIHNAVRQEDDILGYETQRGFFGYSYDYNDFVLLDTNGKFLTNAPTTQYIGENDYCTIGYFAQSDNQIGQNSLLGAAIGTNTSTLQLVYSIKIKFYTSAGVQTGSTITYNSNTANGSLTWQTINPVAQLQYTGVGTANIQAAGGTIPADWAYYTVVAYDNTSSPATQEISKEYKFYKQEVCKGFEKFRLTWLNRLGVWDYFNFTKKNVRKVNSKRETYQQIKGSWNERKYKKYGYKGGQKVFATNSKEVITLQTDFITEEAAQWLEELFTSPDVFVLQERTTDDSRSVASPLSSSVYQVQNKYVQPCVVMTSSYTRKTTANDKLKQYTIEIEMSHNKRIQKA